jgi:hypothetical protein
MMPLEMSSGEVAYLTMAIVAFCSFAGTLFMCRLDYGRSQRGAADTSHRLADALPQAAE